MKWYMTLMLCILFISPVGAETNNCVYPVADGGNEDPSPPSIVGNIIKVSENHITIRPDNEQNTIEIRIGNKTQFFTVFGGFVEKNELKQGQHIYVWYVGCDAKKAGFPPEAAVIQLDSTEPIN